MENTKLVYDKKMDFYGVIMQSTYMHVYFKDRESRFLDASQAQIRGFGCSSLDEIIGKTDADYFSKSFAEEARRDEVKVMETGEPMLNKIERLIWLTGEISWMQVNKYPLYDDAGNIIGTWGSSINVTAITDEKRRLEDANLELKDAGNFYKRQCVIDDMTELFNRRKFYEELSNEYELIKDPANKGREFCISFLDVDNFKAINDHFGHQFGDFIISETAAIIRANVRSGDVVFRFGGDEFLIIYKNTDKKEARAISERICGVLRAIRYIKDHESARITISGGVASSNEAGDIDDLIHYADKRMYKAKKLGRDKIVIQ